MIFRLFLSCLSFRQRWSVCKTMSFCIAFWSLANRLMGIWRLSCKKWLQAVPRWASLVFFNDASPFTCGNVNYVLGSTEAVRQPVAIFHTDRQVKYANLTFKHGPLFPSFYLKSSIFFFTFFLSLPSSKHIPPSCIYQAHRASHSGIISDNPLQFEKG